MEHGVAAHTLPGFLGKLTRCGRLPILHRNQQVCIYQTIRPVAGDRSIVGSSNKPRFASRHLAEVDYPIVPMTPNLKTQSSTPNGRLSVHA